MRRLLRDYVKYHHEDRIHAALNDTPPRRTVENRPSPNAKVIARARGSAVFIIGIAGAKLRSELASADVAAFLAVCPHCAVNLLNRSAELMAYNRNFRAV